MRQLKFYQIWQQEIENGWLQLLLPCQKIHFYNKVRLLIMATFERWNRWQEVGYLDGLLNSAILGFGCNYQKIKIIVLLIQIRQLHTSPCWPIAMTGARWEVKRFNNYQWHCNRLYANMRNRNDIAWENSLFMEYPCLLNLSYARENGDMRVMERWV